MSPAAARRAAAAAAAASALWASAGVRGAWGAAAGPAPMVGVKIYETKRPAADLAREWRELGIDTVFAGTALNADPAFREQVRRAGIARFVILPIFFDPEALEADPGLYAVTAAGERASEEWVRFVCPSREAFRRRKLAAIQALVRETDPDGISIDFIRHFVFWEKVYPDRPPAAIPETCFDASCLDAFQQETGIRLPAGVKGAAAAAAWIRGRHREAWSAWKCGLITRMVRDIAAEARRIKPGLRINLHAVPWRRGDFGGAIRAVAGQDFAELAKHVDLISPMTYAHMVKREPPWVHSVVEELAAQVSRPVVPSIQVGKAYLETPLSVAEFTASLDEALRPPSGGVVFWSWQALEDEPDKKKVIGQRFGARRSGAGAGGDP